MENTNYADEIEKDNSHFRSIAAWFMVVCILILLFFSIVMNASILHANMYKKKEHKVEFITEAAYNIVQGYYNEARAGKLTDKEARTRALEALRNMRYDGKNYIWVNNYDGMMLMHPAMPEMEGNDLNKYQDLRGRYVFVDAIKLAKEHGHAMFEYYWPKPGENPKKGHSKYAYIRGFQPWHWVIASGAYIDDINAEINKSMFSNLVLNFIIFVMVIIAVILFVGKNQNISDHF